MENLTKIYLMIPPTEEFPTRGKKPLQCDSGDIAIYYMRQKNLFPVQRNSPGTSNHLDLIRYVQEAMDLVGNHIKLIGNGL
jgi:hypothetical protein